MHTRPLSLWFSWLTLAVFTAVFVANGNREFLLYAATLSILIGLVQWSNRRLRYPAGVLWCFWLWLVMHMCGGFVHLNGVRLYDIRLLPLVGEPYQILRYDQFVHAFCYFTIGGILKTIVAAQAAPGASRRGLALLTLLAALGVGAVNEIIEFTAVAWFRSDGVGDYFNNALDNVFNAAGALAALAWRTPLRHSHSFFGAAAGGERVS
jgi:putative membrane protein